MITISDYIDDLDEVRSVLGVTDLELPDEVLQQSRFSRTLQIAMSSTTGTFSGTTGSLASILDALLIEADPTEGEEVMMALIQEFAVYTVAEALLPTLGMIATRRLSDGKASVERFAGEELSKTRVAEQIRARLGSVCSQIGESLGIAAASYTLIVRAEPDDIVTAA